MQQIWPADRIRPLTGADLEELYTYPASGPGGRPWVAVNFVSSVDGAVEIDGHSSRLSHATDGAIDRAVYWLGSDLADVVLLGAGTAVGERFTGIHPNAATAERRKRRGLAPVPPIAVVTSGRSLPADAPVITEAEVPTLVVTSGAAPAALRAAWAAAGAEVLVAGEGPRVDLAAAVAALGERGLHRVDCEGGPHLFGSLLAADLVDEVRLTLSPLLVAGAAGRIAAGPALDPARVRLASTVAEGSTLLMRYLRTDSAAIG